MDIDAIAAAARFMGLQGIAITDHNTTDAVRSLKGNRLIERYEIIVVPGIEVSSTEGHILAYGDVGPIPRDRSPEETVEMIIEAGGIPVAAHPYRLSTGIGEAVVRRCDFKAVEVINGRTREGANMKADQLAEELGLAKTGGSDAHWEEQVADAITVFPDDVSTPHDILEALRNGRCDVEGAHPTIGRVFRDASGNTIRWLKRGMRRT